MDAKLTTFSKINYAQATISVYLNNQPSNKQIWDNNAFGVQFLQVQIL